MVPVCFNSLQSRTTQASKDEIIRKKSELNVSLKALGKCKHVLAKKQKTVITAHVKSLDTICSRYELLEAFSKLCPTSKVNKLNLEAKIITSACTKDQATTKNTTTTQAKHVWSATYTYINNK